MCIKEDNLSVNKYYGRYGILGIFWPWLIIGLIRHLYEKAKNKRIKISLSRKLPQVMQTQQIPIPVCLICVFLQVVTGVGCIQYNSIVSQIIKRLTVDSTFICVVFRQ